MAQAYEIDLNGKVYEVEADSEEEAVRAAEYMEGRRQESASIRQQQRTGGSKALTGLADAPRRVVEGFQQLGTAAGEFLGVMDEGATEEQTRAMNVRRLAATGGDPDIEQAADVGEVTLNALPVVSLARGARVLSQLRNSERLWPLLGRAAGGTGGAAGLATGASETAMAPEDVFAERATAAAVGAGIAAPVAMAIGLRPLVHNYVIKLKRQAQINDELVAAKKKMFNVGELTLSQQGGNSVIRSMEIQVKATAAQNFFNRQFERTSKVFNSMIDHFAKRSGVDRGSVSFLNTALRVSEAWKKSSRAAHSAANHMYGQRLSAALDLASKDPSKFPIPFDSLRDTVARWSSETGQPWWRIIHPGANKMSTEFKVLDDYMTSLASRNAKLAAHGAPPEGVGFQEIVRIRRALNNEDQAYWNAINNNTVLTPAQKDAHRAVKEMKDAVDTDIDAFLAADKASRQSAVTVAGQPIQRPAIAALEEYRSANADFRDFQKFQRAMNQTATANWFGGRIVDDPEKALLELARMEPAQQRQLTKVLREQDPEALDQLRVGLMDTAFRQMVNATGRRASRGTVDPDAFAKGITNAYGEVMGKEIFTPAQFAMLNRGLATVRVLREGPENIMSVNRAPGFETTTMAVVSWSSAFLARAMVRISGLGRAERLLFSEEGLRSLEVLRDAYRGGSKYKPNQIVRAVTVIATQAGMTGELPDPPPEFNE